MGDHVFEPPVLQRMLRLDVAPDESLLAIDARPATPRAWRTKRRRSGAKARASSRSARTSTEFDALDTGVFVFSPVLFDALERARALGDTTLSGGVRSSRRAG